MKTNKCNYENPCKLLNSPKEDQSALL